MKLIVISSPEPIAEEAQRINELFEAGLEYFHLRKPYFTPEEQRHLLQQLKPEHYAKIALHQHHELADMFAITRLHFTETKRSMTTAEDLMKLQTAGYQLSTSVHEIASLQRLTPCFSYTFFGPVFNSISKPDYTSKLADGFYLTAAEKPVQVIALGGIDAENVAMIRSMNFDGAAILGSIWQQPEQAVTSYLKIKEKCQALAPMY
ncbi:MAG: thiamine phosphate synthase [Pontibacter sp.]|nr:thiamine phosphate synthase [Pontibacter sp.]